MSLVTLGAVKGIVHSIQKRTSSSGLKKPDNKYDVSNLKRPQQEDFLTDIAEYLTNDDTTPIEYPDYAKDLEKYCSELEEKCKDLEYNQTILKGVLINMQCDDFEKEAIKEGADEDDEKLEVLIEKYEAVVTAGIDFYLKGKND